MGILLLLIVAGVFTFQVFPLSWGWHDQIVTSGGVAIDGYDPVAYFTEGKAAPGKKEFHHNWMEAEWHFSSQENLEMFKANPQAYLPQFGGYCAQAVSSGITIVSNPEIWHIENGKLYFFLGEDPKAEWTGNIPTGVIATTEANWQAAQ